MHFHNYLMNIEFCAEYLLPKPSVFRSCFVFFSFANKIAHVGLILHFVSLWFRAEAGFFSVIKGLILVYCHVIKRFTVVKSVESRFIHSIILLPTTSTV